MLALDVPGRMRAFRVRKDRAEVIGIAAIVFTTLAKWLNLRTMLVPGVGVREGMLLDLVAAQYSVRITPVKRKKAAPMDCWPARDGLRGGWITIRSMRSR